MAGPARETTAVRSERPGDAEGIARVHEEAFGRPEEARLVEAIRESAGYRPDLSLVAVVEGRVVGHLLLSEAALVGEEERTVLALAPMGVLPEYQRSGVGTRLVRAALARADADEAPLVVLVGHAGYYPRFGFEPAAPLGIEAPFEVPDESWLAARLSAYEPSLRGRIRFPPAFDGL